MSYRKGAVKKLRDGLLNSMTAKDLCEQKFRQAFILHNKRYLDPSEDQMLQSFIHDIAGQYYNKGDAVINTVVAEWRKKKIAMDDLTQGLVQNVCAHKGEWSRLNHARARAREPGTQSRRMRRKGRQRRELTKPNSQRVPVHWRRRRPGAPPLRVKIIMIRLPPHTTLSRAPVGGRAADWAGVGEGGGWGLGWGW
eukprot:2316521-Rhodomonas_salina.1